MIIIKFSYFTNVYIYIYIYIYINILLLYYMRMLLPNNVMRVSIIKLLRYIFVVVWCNNHSISGGKRWQHNLYQV